MICEVCRITLSENDLPSHLNGKKHKKKVDQHKRLFGIDVSENPTSASKPSSETSTSATNKSEETKKTDVIEKPGAAASTQPAAVPLPTNQGKKRGRKKDKMIVNEVRLPPAFVDKAKPFPAQVEQFLRQVQQTENEWINVQWVLRDVAFTFSQVIPNVRPMVYGSQATGLAFQTSDVDVYLHNPAGEEDETFVRNHGRVIYRTRLFSDIVLITQARVPVIKAKHIGTGIEVDISATSSHAVANSSLLRVLLAADWRVKRLLMLIGYWAKKCQLIHTSKFSRYSINLLVIFYLQNVTPRILPRIRDVVSGSPESPWPCYINESFIHSYKNGNKLPLNELFINFFDFYSMLPFTENIISTYLGIKIPITDFERNPKILDDMIYYKIHVQNGGAPLMLRTTCVQDPLELNHNTSKQITDRTLHQFVQSCKKMLELKEKFQVQDWMTEFLQGQVAKPILDSPSALEFAIFLSYQTSNDWMTSFKIDLTKALSYLRINTGTNLSTDHKKTKYDKDCLRFYVETNVNPFNPECKKLLTLLRNRTVDFQYFLNNIENVRTLQNNEKITFSAHCFVSSPEANRVKVLFSNEGDHISFYKISFNAQLIQCLFTNMKDHFAK